MVLESPQDYLVPIFHKLSQVRTQAGRAYPGMIYIRANDVDGVNLSPEERSILESCRLSNHPVIKLDTSETLSYLHISDVWYIILTPYQVSIPNNARWEFDLGGDKLQERWPREITNPLALKLARNLSASGN